ncbi:MAG: Holliday junction branch migration protein RuvA [Clostridiales bacterium]|mgnify:FL=1|jgi:Holliday junction DNA helicase RuvA|nr:Holliday junction branch migration protein RuvA [Clostridiales bacterium]MDD7414650.1 Holliday junction branch migration protein RuvA [Clostridiales bacterium]MDY5732663.1 Holliday junction branch migration protein RuvA [Eubacteriales bacterium]
MFAFLEGIADSIDADRVIINVSGVGYELLCSRNTLDRIGKGEVVRLYTHFQLSQDAVALYGFVTQEERAMFRQLITVSKIGPRTALSALSVLTPSDITSAIVTENAAAFEGVPGIGKKTAARLLLELKEKISLNDIITANARVETKNAVSASNAMRSEAVAALMALGYDGVSAGRAVNAVDDCERVEDMITAALKAMPN